MSSESENTLPEPARPAVRWWPAGLILGLFVLAVLSVRLDDNRPFQQRNLATLTIALSTAGLLLLWWLLLSRTRWRLRLGGFAAVLALAGGFQAGWHFTGMSGDLVPIFEPRWNQRANPTAPPPTPGPAGPTPVAVRPDFPQFLGPDRTGILPAAGLATHWATTPPIVVWRRPVGTGWSGFAIVGQRALTQEQVGEQELVTCYALSSGELLWRHAYPARYVSPIAGDGPRATPTVVSNRVFTLGSLGQLHCVELATGKPLWSRSLTNDAGSTVPEWGFSGSPLVTDGLVLVSAGGKAGKSLLAYRANSGELVWAGGDDSAGYGSPLLLTLAGQSQVVLFNRNSVVGHDPATGRQLWRQPWGVGYPLVAMPMQVAPAQFLVSAGYNAGAELFAVQRETDGAFSVASQWKSKRLKAKFANPYVRAGFAYGLDDGILACLDLKDGTQRWKEGRHGHGQGLLVGDAFLLLAENGELLLLQPTPEGPNERGRFRVFTDKTWNPLALSGDLLLARNDREAALVRLPLTP